MKKLLLGLLVLSSFIAKAQVYNNEWIDYSKTYYKFKVGKTGLYRIPQLALSSAGLGSTPAEYFQLWRNGKQIPLYTSIATGSLSASDYIEFWGEMNDGKPDKELYRDPKWQLNDKWSLETDTAAYFLTVNNDVSSNLRLQTTANSVAGTSLPADAYFMYTAGKYFKDRLNDGTGVYAGENIYSSSYDKGEGWTSPQIFTSFDAACTPTYGSYSFSLSNLNVYKGTSAPAVKFKIAVSGNSALSQRNYFVKLNSDSMLKKPVDFFNYSIDSTIISANVLDGNNDVVTVYNYSSAGVINCVEYDQMVIHRCEITYPRTFNFNNQSNFEFTLAANAAGNYLQITNFSYGSSTPVLYDLTNGKRYVADLSSAPTLKFVLQPSSVDRNLVLVSEEAANLNTISTIKSRNFVNYADASNQGDYIIISHPYLFAGAGGSNPVEDYKVYRSSAAGGGYTAKIYLSDELMDQFGFGIKKNPAAIRNFLRYSRNNFSIAPKQVLIIGRGMTYPSQRSAESAVAVDRLNLVPTFGSPASDVLLTAEPGSSQPTMSIGRLSVISPSEVAAYLKKVKDFEQEQAYASPLIKDKAWTKNIAHIVGVDEEDLNRELSNSLAACADIIKGPYFGANVFNFNKTTVDAVSQIGGSFENLMNNGLSIITYFGHSSATTLKFNLDNPENYSNFKKYPLFIGLGCNVGNFFGYSTTRLQTYKATLSENYVLAPDRGTIGLVGSTHFGIPYSLEIWAQNAYQNFGKKSYDGTIGEVLKQTAADAFSVYTQENFLVRANIEESLFHGDPAVHLNPHIKPDYAVEDSMVKVSPAFISVADASFKLDAKFLNIGKSPDSAIVIEVKKQRPDQSIVIVRRDTIPGISYAKSISVNVPIDPIKDKGLNKIIVTIDADNNVDELFENNNTITKEVRIYEDEARPIFPYNFAIVNTQNIKLVASTANPFATRKQYKMELDTTELFNSPFKITKTVDSSGGIMEFQPGITFTDSTVYYWRVAPVSSSGNPTWSSASFIYLANSEVGFNQSHFFQQLKASGENISLDSSSRKWKYGNRVNNLFIKQGSWVTSGAVSEGALTVSINGEPSIRGVCDFQSLIFNVFDPVTFEPWRNQVLIPENSPGYPLGLGLYGSHANQCRSDAERYWSFEYRYTDSATRKKALDFMQNVVPDGAYVVVRNMTLDPATFPGFQQAFANDWLADESVYGPGQSLYSSLKNAGLTSIDSFYRARPFALVYKKNDPSFTPEWVMGEGVFDNPTLSVDCITPDTTGKIVSPVFGPAKSWKELKWNGATLDTKVGDNPRVDIVGVKNDGSTDVLISDISLSEPSVDVSSIDAKTYPYLQLAMQNGDTVNVTPYQLNYWRLTYDPAPEGGVNPSQYFIMKDTVEVGEPLSFKMAFKNVTDVSFDDSMKVKVSIIDRNNAKHDLPPVWLRKLNASPDTLHITYPQLDTRQLTGSNSMFVEVNPDADQPEQYHFNNFFVKNFYVRGDTLNPLLDVTFDNVHIINHDIVSPKPNILIKLKDEAKWYPIDDTSAFKIQVQYPDNTLHPYSFTSDTLQFTPAGQQVPVTNNAASAVFKPYFPLDGEYQLIVTAKDMSQNHAGPTEYRVAFQVINKPMISNMLNYPNPFTTSTAFVFTITGQVPQNIRIQILTVTGKIVREITKDELGPLHIGRNITDFKWDGTDQYGQRLANGVYLYRVITNLDGKSVDKYSTKETNTDKYFNKGYGKMYLMR